MLLSRQDFNNMMGNDDNQDEVTFKVADRRKFNSDGSVKEGVVLEAAKVKEKPAEQLKVREAASASTRRECLKATTA